jgi:hypothetical protein
MFLLRGEAVTSNRETLEHVSVRESGSAMRNLNCGPLRLTEKAIALLGL